MGVWIFLLYTWNYHNIINQLYSNKNKLYTFLKVWLTGCFLMEQGEQGWADRKIEEVTYSNPLPGMTALLNNLSCSMILSTALLALANLSEVILAPSHVITFKCVSLLYLTINALRQIYLWVTSTLMKQIQRHWVQNYMPINYLTFLKLNTHHNPKRGTLACICPFVYYFLSSLKIIFCRVISYKWVL